MQSRPHRRHRAAALPALATVLAGSVLLADPAAAAAAAATRAVPAAEAGSVSAALEVSSSTPWYTSGQFVVRNTGDTAAGWQLRFRVSGGTFENWASWTADTAQDGDLVTITAKPGQELAPGATANLSFGMNGDGTAVPSLTACSIDGLEVAGCTPDEELEPEPEPDPEPDPDPGVPDEDTVAPGTVPGFGGEAVDAHAVRLHWDAATDDRGVDSYVVTRDGAAPVRVGGDVREARIADLPAGTSHTFTVTAVDAVGNVGPGATTTVATPSVPAPPQHLVVEADHSVVPVRALGDAEAARRAEGRRFRHAAHEPTGRYVNAGETITVTVPDGVSGLVARFGLYGVYAGINGGQDVGTREVALQPGKHTLQVPLSGPVQVRDTGAEGARTTTVRIDGGDAMATFVEGETTESQFAERMAATRAPIVELVGENVLVQVQRPVAQRWLLNAGIAVGPRIRMMERFVTKTDRVFGLDRAATGAAHRADQRVLVVNPDSGGGYASATNDRITFQNATGAMQDLLSKRPADQWGFWHEVGHTYQPDWMNWAGLGEVSVNVFSLANQEHLTPGENRLDDAATRAKVAAYFAKPQADRNHDHLDLWARLLMFDQLRRAYGDDVYARMAQQFRVDRALGGSVPASSDTAARKQQFALVAAQVTDRDLSGFFDAWGLGLTDETRAAMADRPDPAFDLTTNHDRRTDRTDRTVSYSVPSGTLSVSGTATYGQRTAGGSLTVDVRPDAGVTRGRMVLQTSALGTATGSVLAELRTSDGTPDVLRADVDVRRGTMVQYRGLGDAVVAELVLDPGSGSLWVRKADAVPTAHPNFSSRYAGARVVAADGTPVADGWMRGVETAGAFAARFGEVEVSDGQYLVLDHLEPKNRLLRWSAGTELAKDTAQQQAFRIEDGALVPVPLSSVPHS
ncbi:hypothetical protein E9228_001022 [Curtobacterium flaccumfaciens]|uniref:Peptidase M60 domain-containing protein n=1 Tax=Curtobacterium salicis TaxID=1779862 RepID=A0ABX0T7F0_9MICO|nr:M60 family metallopeptidase [Curtobacterium sp. WW7]NII40386.1 hypothetical protein [Curtobacterium sp. WW7]